MFEIGIEKILLIMVVILLLFGAKRIPEIGKSLGKGIREFKKSMNEISRDVAREVNIDPTAPQLPVLPAPQPPQATATTTQRAEPKRLL
jgi:sec-independent protein translocase protein TatA